VIDRTEIFEQCEKHGGLKEVNLHSIDEQPKEAAISLLWTIAYHKRHSRRAEERDLEERLRYHEASRKDAEEAAVGRLEYVEVKPAEAELPKSGRYGL
jgi:hypothetical protein